MTPRATFWVAAAAVLSLVSPGAWGAWHGTGNRNAPLASARVGYQLTGSNVTGGGTGYSGSFVLPLLGLASDTFSVKNTGTAPETITATVGVGGVNIGSLTVYGCPNTFSGVTCTGRVTLTTSPGPFTMATSLAPGATYNLAVQITGILGLGVTVTIPANSITLAWVGGGANRTSG
ncbi:hypothetical protein GCM10009547_48940 [Sporichthya brevicatena]|uniref:Choice-of-anchor D domain-containing protein n=1 Tax=Sporichthya brevicatena TaxID=171442 RepID=A0ABP3SL91_9ACTN